MSSDESELGEALAAYVELQQRGQAPPIDEFVRRYPKVAADPKAAGELKRCLDLLALSGASTSDRDGGPDGDPRNAPGLPFTLGDFVLRKVIGRGGMGVVYEAEQKSLKRHVAVKLLAPGGARDPKYVARFQREVEVTARLQHPNIVAVFHADEAGGVPFYAMPLLDGESLDVTLARMRAEPHRGVLTSGRELAVWIARFVDVARALHAAHGAGVLHRDLKPSNLFLETSGRLLILDFGLSRELDSDAASLTGAPIGTPRYMSPEQVLGKHDGLDGRTDVFSLGATLYEFLTLGPAFEGEHREALFRAVLSVDPPPAHSVDARVPADLESIVSRALEKRPQERYASAAEFADDLQRFLDFQPVHARPVGLVGRLRRRARRNPLAAGALVAAFVALAALNVVSWRAKRASDRAALDLQSAQAKTLDQLRETERFSDRLVVRRRLEEADGLWPCVPRMKEPMAAWLVRADEVVERGGAHEEALHRFEQQAAQAAAPVDLKLQWRLETTQELLQDLGLLRQRMQDVRARIARIGELERTSFVEASDVWKECTLDVGGSAVYGGLELPPQFGLVPLGVNQESGLWEFWHVESGARPELDPATGRFAAGGGAGLVFVLLPGGRFVMGSSPETHITGFTGRNLDKNSHSMEQPTQEVELDAFFLSKYEMTQGQWLRVMGSNPSSWPKVLPGVAGSPARLAYPVEEVTWVECVEMARRLGLELPTEAQWEYGCRAGTDSVFSWGSSVADLVGRANVADQAASVLAAQVQVWEQLKDGFASTAPVGSLRPNGFGLHDMHGNVSEWCREAWFPYDVVPLSGDGLRDAPASHPDVDLGLRMFRGGNWVQMAERVRSAARDGGAPSMHNHATGVRPGRSLDHP